MASFSLDAVYVFLVAGVIACVPCMWLVNQEYNYRSKTVNVYPKGTLQEYQQYRTLRETATAIMIPSLLLGVCFGIPNLVFLMIGPGEVTVLLVRVGFVGSLLVTQGRVVYGRWKMYREARQTFLQHPVPRTDGSHESLS